MAYELVDVVKFVSAASGGKLAAWGALRTHIKSYRSCRGFDRKGGSLLD
jgi:hypothetical protein